MKKPGTSGTKPNNKYKDSVFTVLFGDKESLLSLYKVLHPEDVDVTINDIEKIVLKNVLLIRRYNDVAMNIRDRLVVLSEQQSTLNPNMPVRLLLYIAEEYENIIKKNGDTKTLYSRKLINLPAPEFYVIYTGNEECADYMCLSDSFPGEYKENAFIQLNVKVITSEDEHNILGGYIAFVKKAEELRHTPGYTLTEALKEAVQWCREENILDSFMEERSEELMSLMLEEWNIEDAIKYSKEEGIEEGMERGLECGLARGLEQGRHEGMKNGMVYAYYEMNMQTNEIAERLQLSESEVLEIIKNMKKNMQ